MIRLVICYCRCVDIVLFESLKLFQNIIEKKICPYSLAAHRCLSKFNSIKPFAWFIRHTEPKPSPGRHLLGADLDKLTYFCMDLFTWRVGRVRNSGH